MYSVVITAFLDVFVIAHIIRGERRAGTLSFEIPQSRLIRLLPRSRLRLSVVLALVFAVLMTGINGGLFYFCALHSLSLPQFIFWKAVYSFVMSALIIKFAISRLVQPD